MRQDQNPASLVITRLMGGLGNQMFQYATGRALALRCGTGLKLDLSGFAAVGVHTRRRYELDPFPICGTAATEADLARFDRGSELRSPRRDWVLRLLSLDRPRSAWPIYRESHFHFDSRVIELSPPIYLDGYWQSERYFSNITEALRREFTSNAPFDSENAVLVKLIDSVNSVSLHVRRGDYVVDPITNRYHGVCSPDYYQRAVDYIAARVEAPHLFAFSDDQQWTRANLRFSVPVTFVDANPPDLGYCDMRLMTRCRHHIVANSSFSWWGAWLNPSREKIVIAPQQWFGVSNNNTRDLIPPNWVRL